MIYELINDFLLTRPAFWREKLHQAHTEGAISEKRSG
jgi:hypothetical protein